MVKWQIFYTKQAEKDAKKIAANGLKNKTLILLDFIAHDPFVNPPPYEKLVQRIFNFGWYVVPVSHSNAGMTRSIQKPHTTQN